MLVLKIHDPRHQPHYRESWRCGDLHGTNCVCSSDRVNAFANDGKSRRKLSRQCCPFLRECNFASASDDKCYAYLCFQRFDLLTYSSVGDVQDGAGP